MLETGEIGQMTLRSIVDPDFMVEKFEFFEAQKLPMGEWQVPSMKDVEEYNRLKDVEIVELPKPWEVELLIGVDLAATLVLDDVRRREFYSPVGIKTLWGWTLMGPRAGKSRDPTIYSSFIDFDEENLSRELNAMFQHDFSPPRSLRPGWSTKDRNAMKILEKTCKFQGDKYETVLLCKNGSHKAAPRMPTSTSEIMVNQQTL